MQTQEVTQIRYKMCIRDSLYGSAHCYYLVNGSTCGILASICAAVKKRGRILVARNSHKAVYHLSLIHILRGLGIMRPFLIANIVNLAIRLFVAMIFAPCFGIAFVWLANQPDIIYVSHEKPNTISVDDIRTPVSYTHLDVYKRQIWEIKPTAFLSSYPGVAGIRP